MQLNDGVCRCGLQSAPPRSEEVPRNHHYVCLATGIIRRVISETTRRVVGSRPKS